MKNTERRLAIFDLDGTITRKDTLLEFIRFTHGSLKLWAGLFFLSPVAVLLLAGLVRRQMMKEAVLTFFFKGYGESKLRKVGDDFGTTALPGLCKSSALEKLAWHKREGHEIVILSASCDVWLNKWCEQMNVSLISSRMNFKNLKATGKLQGRNCRGFEKADRLKHEVNLAEYSHIYAYGDSESDRHYYALATEFHHKVF